MGRKAGIGSKVVLSTAGRIAVVLACWSLAGCGRSGGLRSGGSALEQGCAAYASIYRARETRCYGVAAEPDEPDLIARQTESCVLNSSAPGSATDAAYWSTCAAAADNNCGGYRCATYPLGARQAGEPCLVSLQCASLWCRGTQVMGADGVALSNALQCGTCATRLPAGSFCDSTADVCEVGLSCFQGTCRAQGQAGALCAVSNDCVAPNLACRSSGICGSVVGKGQACSANRDCTTLEGCDPVQKVCVPFKFGQPGASCDDVVSHCEAGTCSQETGTCPAVLSDGALCDPNSGAAVCQVYARCFFGVCQIPNPAACN
jgi:hypothetical protein